MTQIRIAHCTWNILLYCIMTLPTFASETQDTSGNRLEASAFDFWLGSWNATWQEAGVTYHAKNIVSKKMNGKFIHENFTILDGPQKGFKGESYSILDPLTGVWRQTWIDTDGSYFDFVGILENGIKIFERTVLDPVGNKLRQRMKFYNVTKDSFQWDWEGSRNDGEWKLLWRLQYRRAD